MKKKLILSLAIVAALAFTACTFGNTNTTTNGASNTATNAASDVTATTVPTSSASTSDYTGLTSELSNYDQNADYDESACITVTLNGDSATISGSGASYSNGKLSITAEGSYILTGTLTDGYVYVSVADNAKVRLILNGVNISCSTGPAIYIENADKTSITLASGTTNTVSDGSAYTDGNACIYSKDDLTINGSGSLTVTANCNNGIGCKNDLKIVSGTITVTAVANGLKGNDSVGIFGGTITVTAGKDGIKSDTDDDTTKGFVYIAGGTVKVTASDDGIQAVTVIALVGGSVSISTEDSQLNCDGTVYKADGVLK